MKRRTIKKSESQVPEMLVRFDRADWPARTADEAFAAWKSARAEFAAVSGWPGGQLTRLREQRVERLRVYHGTRPLGMGTWTSW